MKPTLFHVAFLLIAASLFASAQDAPEKTIFQTASHWRAEMDIRSDVAVIYGMNESFSERAKSWQDRGYGIQFMTGVAWGGYQDYIEGRFDGKTHHDEGQVERDGTRIMHGATVPYMVPTPSYIEYLKTLIKRAIDGGAKAIFLEEPEFWNRGGYSDGFKREWKAYYGEDWQAQHSTPDAAYRSAKLKYHLYFRALKELFLYAKDYSESKGERVRCYVPTHTLINYSAWSIVSPEANLANLPGMDGYIAQVWTGTARTPTFFHGIERERTFENAFLEYGSMLAMTQPTGRRVYFLTDPIEDNPNHSWEDYKLNYEATFTAQLLHPAVDHYEVMPWPNRIFFGKYQVGGSSERQPIPPDYATEIQVLINALNDMPKSDNRVTGAKGIGVLLSDSMMFQRFPTFKDYQDPRLSNLYGMALPLVKRGVPVQLVQMENLLQPDVLKDVRVLVMSYANMKPLSPSYHQALAQWVQQGGMLLFAGRDDDPYQTVREWWNQDGAEFAAPSVHLFQQMGVIQPNAEGRYPVGKGTLSIIRQNPKEFAMAKDGGERMVSEVQRLYGTPILQKNYLALRRGPYFIVSVMQESVSNEPFLVQGPVIDLYDPQLPVLLDKELKPGQRGLFYQLVLAPDAPCVLAAASRAYQETKTDAGYSFVMKGPLNINGVARVLLPSQPKSINANVNGEAVDLKYEWNAPTKTLLLRYANSPEGVSFEIKY
ncbi:MAG: hypothetical protein P9L94_00795 [Candidatus Hinthialibacter antarcticus]|nr:hypothetical protein [Candidatus Hinthialibacter antarcticus]